MSSKTKTTTTKEEAKPALVPKLRFPEFRGAEGWESTRLGDLCEVITKGSTPTSYGFDYVDAGVRFVKIESLGGGSVDCGKTAFITEDCNTSFLRSQLKENDILFSIAGALGVIALVGRSILPANVNQAIGIVRLKPGYSHQFLLHQLQGDLIQAEIQRIRAGAAQPNISLTQLGDFAALLPDKAEQQKIAECLSSVDELMAAQARKVDALKTHKKGLMQQLFPREGETQPRLRFPEFQTAEEWEEVALGDIAEIKLGKMLDKQKHTRGHLLPYLNNLAVRWNEVNTSNLPKMFFNDHELDRFGLRAGDVVVCEGGEPGRSAVWDGRLPDLKFQKAIHRVRFNVPFEPKILVLHLENLAGTTAFERLFTGGGIKHLTGETFSRLKIPLIPLPEQQRIAECLSSLDAQITAETQKLDALKTHKKGLMQQLFPSLEEVET
ncbi:MAG: restriction endonuclease subunit S [Opitutales bacterium]|nr:restriction endonuclease subunit S [Opitutales bacterium]